MREVNNCALAGAAGRRFAWLPCRLLWAALLLTGCGGGQQAGEDSPARTQQASAQARQVIGTPKVLNADKLMDWAQQNLPQLFPGPQPTYGHDDFEYRVYPASGNALAVTYGPNGIVYMLGTATGGSLVRLGC